MLKRIAAECEKMLAFIIIKLPFQRHAFTHLFASIKGGMAADTQLEIGSPIGRILLRKAQQITQHVQRTRQLTRQGIGFTFRPDKGEDHRRDGRTDQDANRTIADLD